MAADTRLTLAQIDLYGDAAVPPRRDAAPMLPLAVGLGIGIVLDDRLAIPSFVGTILLLAGVSIMALPRRFRHRTAMITAVFIASVGLGALRHAVADRMVPSNDIVRFVQPEASLVRIRGEIISTPLIREPDPDVPRAYPTGPKTRFLLRPTHVKGIKDAIPVVGRVVVNINGPRLGLRVGQHVEMTGRIHRIMPPGNPGEFDWQRHSRHQGIRTGLSCDHEESARLVSRPDATGWRGALDAVRARLRGYLLDDTFEEQEHDAAATATAPILAAMTLGERSAVPRAMNELFLRTGNAHLLAASGMHVGWLALIGWFVARMLDLSYRTTAVLVAMLIVSYVVIAEPRPSILRAGVVGVLACISAFARGRYNSINALAFAAVVLLLLRPTDLFSAAFQFTFLATIGLLHFCPIVSQAIADALAGRNLHRVARAFDLSPRHLQFNLPARRTSHPDRSRGTIGHRAIAWCGVLLAQSFALSLSEWIITTPLASYHFDMLAPWGWLGAYVAWFFALPTVCLGYVTVLCGIILPSSAQVLGPLLAAAAHAMLGVIELLAALPYAILRGQSPSGAWVLAVYASFWVWAYRRDWLRRGTIRTTRVVYVAMIVGLVLWWLLPTRWARMERGALLVWMLAVGDGTGTVIELPDGRVVVYDFGTRSPFNAGVLATNFLNHRGIREIDTLFISHTDFDHLSAVGQIAERFRIGRVIINDHFEHFAPEGGAAHSLLGDLRRRGIPIEVIAGPRVFEEFDPVRVECIWPASRSERRIIEPNDASTVLRLTYQNRTILLPGDILEAGQARLMAQATSPQSMQLAAAVELPAASVSQPFELLRADVLALPHHGGVVHNTRAFVEAIDPSVAVRSTGQRKYLTTNSIERLVGQRDYYSTADDGCVLIRICDGELEIRPWRQD